MNDHLARQLDKRMRMGAEGPRSIPPSGAPTIPDDDRGFTAADDDDLAYIPPTGSALPPEPDIDDAHKAWLIVGVAHAGAYLYTLWTTHDRPLVCLVLSLAIAASWVWQTNAVTRIARAR